MQQNRVDVGGEQGEYPFYAYTIRDLTYCKGCGETGTLDLNHVSFERLDPLLVAFHNFIVNGNVVTGFKLRKLFFLLSVAREQTK